MFLNKTWKQKFWNNFKKWLSITLSISLLSETQLLPGHGYWQYCWPSPTNESCDWGVASVLPAVPLHAMINLSGSSTGTVFPTPHQNVPKRYQLSHSLEPFVKIIMSQLHVSTHSETNQKFIYLPFGTEPKASFALACSGMEQGTAVPWKSPYMYFHEPFAKQERGCSLKMPLIPT